MKGAVLISLFFVFLLPYIMADIKPGILAISIYPAKPLQGDPVLVVADIPEDVSLMSVQVGTITLDTFSFKGRNGALVGIDLGSGTGIRRAVAHLSNGVDIFTEFTIVARPRIVEKLGIPKKLGGDTAASQARLVANLLNENKILASTKTESRALWEDVFAMPLASTIITDTYGYVRLAGVYSIPHKGVDFRAAAGTPVFAMNRGIVRLAQEFRVYGKTVVIDHGLGLQSIYMHLSEFKAQLGQIVKKGQVIALSGDSGYAEFPHLHVSVRIGGISIDPVAFLALLGEDSTLINPRSSISP